MDKKMFPLFVLLLLSLIPVTGVFAGSFNAIFDSDDDMHTELHAGSGGALNVMVSFTDFGDNPYGYGVDTTLFETETSYTGGGYIDLWSIRTDSKLSYGAAGQESYTQISSTETGYLEWRDWSNYASFKQPQYKMGSLPYDFGATGNYEIFHLLEDADDDGAYVRANGVGSADVKLMGSQSQGSWFNMGCLPVCGDGEAWDNNYAKFTGSGVGGFQMSAWAHNELFLHEGGITIPGDGTPGSAYYSLSVGYSGTLTYPDFGVKGN